MIAFQGQERVATWVSDLGSDGGLTAHRSDGHRTALDGEPVEQCWNHGDRIGCGLRLARPDDEAAVLCTPRREQVQGGRGGGPVTRGLHGLAIQGEERPLGALRDRLRPGHTARLQALGMQAGKDAATGIVRGDPMRQGEEGLESIALAFAKELHILQAFPAHQERAHGNDQDLQEGVLLRPLYA